MAAQREQIDRKQIPSINDDLLLVNMKKALDLKLESRKYLPAGGLEYIMPFHSCCSTIQQLPQQNHKPNRNNIPSIVETSNLTIAPDIGNRKE